MPNKQPLTYAEAGVDIDEGARLVELIAPAARATARSGTEASLGGFAAAFDLKAAGFKDPLVLTTTDGVGTKLKIAIEAGKHDTVGIDLVAMCVNDLVAQGAEPLVFLDYYATGALYADEAAVIIRGIAEGCRRAGCALAGGETAEMPGMYRKGDYDLAGFSMGAAERGTLLPKLDQIKAGDVLDWPCLQRPAFERLFARAQSRRTLRPEMDRFRAVRAQQDAGRRAARTDAHLCESAAAADPRK